MNNNELKTFKKWKEKISNFDDVSLETNSHFSTVWIKYDGGVSNTFHKIGKKWVEYDSGFFFESQHTLVTVLQNFYKTFCEK